MNWHIIKIVFCKELRDSLRDRRAIISMIVVPVFAIPMLMLGVGIMAFKSMTHARAEIPQVMVVGGANSPKVLAELRAAGNLQIVAATTDFTNQIVEKHVRAVVKLPPDFDSVVARGDKVSIEIYEFQGDIKSGFAAGNLDTFFHNLGDATVRERLQTRGVPVDLLKPFAIQRQNVAPPARVAGSLFGGILPYLIIVMCLTGAMYPATDSTAGEKERINLVLGKFLMVLTASISTVLLSLLSTGATLHCAKQLLAHSLPPQALVAVTTLDLSGLAGVFLLLLPVAVMLSALLLMVGLFSKSFREAQSYAGPLMLIAIVPTIPALLPGIELNHLLAVVPLVNVSLACKEMMAGTWHWNYLLLIFGSASVYAAAALAATVWMFHREEVLFRS